MKNSYEEILKLGLIKVSQKKYNISKEYFIKLIKVDKKRHEGYLNLSNLLILENKQQEAIDLLESYLKKIYHHPEIINILAINFFNSNNFEELIRHVELYIKKHDNHLLNYFKGYYLNNINRVIDSEIYLKRSIELNNSFWPSYELIFNIYDLKGKLNEMNELIKKAEKNFKENTKLKYFEAVYYFRIFKYEMSHKILNNKKTRNFFIKNNNSSLLADYYNLLSKNYEKIFKYKKCLHYACKRNSTLINLEKNKIFKKNDLLGTINTYINFFDIRNKHKFNSKNTGLNHSNLTFLVGFPRSGTTLLDTILRTHSKTMVMEEKPYLLNTRHEFFKNNQLSNLFNLDKKKHIKIQENYFKSFNYDPNKVIIDKFPLNLIELGFIKTIFPNSKVILAIRHPLDCVLSCVLTAFKINEAMLNFENLKTTAFFYNTTFTLLIKYIEFFNMNFYQIKYENVVYDFDNQIKNLLTYLNLEFENSILKFYDTAKNREKITTPSYDQVVKPIYSNSVNRHLNFKDVKSIKKDVEKWINYFSYVKS